MQANFSMSLSTPGVLLDGGTMDDVAESAVIAEDSGYCTGVWVATSYPAIVMLSAIATRPERVSPGTPLSGKCRERT